jgi:hypothetical protein
MDEQGVSKAYHVIIVLVFIVLFGIVIASAVKLYTESGNSHVGIIVDALPADAHNVRTKENMSHIHRSSLLTEPGLTSYSAHVTGNFFSDSLNGITQDDEAFAKFIDSTTISGDINGIINKKQ